MIKFVVVLLVAALIAALFGYGAFGDYSWPGARNFFYFFLVAAGLLLLTALGVFSKSQR
jgi:uncharacterized membrane protein YtjA (UPF0391 family)